jgi:cysteine-rich repeat protein
MTGLWNRHREIPDLDQVNDFATHLTQRGTDVRFGGYVGAINPTTGAFNLRIPYIPGYYHFCAAFFPLTGTVAADGLTYAATGFVEEPLESAPDHCGTYGLTETGTRCGSATIDLSEECDDGNLANADGCSALCEVEQCWTCANEPSVCTPVPGGSCNDGTVCTTGDTCAADGSCDGTPVTCEPCFACDATLGCLLQPRPVCKFSLAPDRSLMLLKNPAGDRYDRFFWRWNKGATTTAAELGSPPGGDDVTMCIYDESTPTPALLFRATMPGGSGWTADGSGFEYESGDGTPEGMTSAQLKSGAAEKAKARVKGKGAHLSDRPHGLPAFPLPLPLRVQLHGENGLCLQTRHDAGSVVKNDAARSFFKARGIH